MKKYIKPAAELTAGINVDSYMTTATTNHGDTIGDGGGTGNAGEDLIITGKRRGRYQEEEDDPILQLLIDKEEGNGSDLW